MSRSALVWSTLPMRTEPTVGCSNWKIQGVATPDVDATVPRFSRSKTEFEFSSNSNSFFCAASGVLPLVGQTTAAAQAVCDQGGLVSQRPGRTGACPNWSQNSGYVRVSSWSHGLRPSSCADATVGVSAAGGRVVSVGDCFGNDNSGRCAAPEALPSVHHARWRIVIGLARVSRDGRRLVADARGGDS